MRRRVTTSGLASSTSHHIPGTATTPEARRSLGASLRRAQTRYGRDGLACLTADLIDYTERLVRQEILSWPDGTATFTDYLGSDGIEACDVPITATVTIDGDEVIADLTESAPMVRGALNSTRSFVMACVYQAVRCAARSRCRTRPARSGRCAC